MAGKMKLVIESNNHAIARQYYFHSCGYCRDKIGGAVASSHGRVPHGTRNDDGAFCLYHHIQSKCCFLNRVGTLNHNDAIRAIIVSVWSGCP